MIPIKISDRDNIHSEMKAMNEENAAMLKNSREIRQEDRKTATDHVIPNHRAFIQTKREHSKCSAYYHL